MFNSIFDELKEVKYFKEITDFKSVLMKSTLIKEIKRLNYLQKAEAYLAPKRASICNFFWIHLKVYYFRNKSSIIDVWLGYIYRPPKILKFSK